MFFGEQRWLIGVWGLFLLLLLIPQACIEPYEADIEEEVKVLSIEGSLIKGDSVQRIKVSRTTTLSYQQFIPIRGCIVRILDEQGTEFVFDENPDGIYELAIPEDQLIINRGYQLRVLLPSGDEYLSDVETLNSGTEIDSVYYAIENKVDRNSGEELIGLQFFTDIKAADSISRYFRWKLTETYEYTSTAPVSYYYADGSLEPLILENAAEVFRCWKTNSITDLYLSSTVNLTVNEKKRIPLIYVSNVSDRLKIKYSLFVEQYTLSESAYNYWLNNKVATQESGGLYTQQPGSPVSNIRNSNDSTETVVGFFWTSVKTKHRLFVPRINEMPVIGDVCELAEFDFLEHGDGPFPRYIYEDQVRGQILTGSAFCFICTLRGGTTTKPDFWE